MKNPGLKWLVDKYYKKAKDATIFGIPLEKLTKEELMSVVVQANEALERERKMHIDSIEFLCSIKDIKDILLQRGKAKLDGIPCIVEECEYYDKTYEQNCRAKKEDGTPYILECSRYRPEDKEEER